MRRAAIRLLGALVFTTASAMAESAGPTERELHNASCIAALSVKADDLARRIRAGQPELKPLLMVTLDAGAAFIGNAYLQGDRDEARSQAQLDAALQAQKALSDVDLALRQAGCAKEGERLLSEADLLGRAVISRFSQRRLQKLLGD
ncbi:MAG: hypothetical protein ACOYNZ_11840 [Rhodoferax sp.]